MESLWASMFQARSNSSDMGIFVRVVHSKQTAIVGVFRPAAVFWASALAAVEELLR